MIAVPMLNLGQAASQALRATLLALMLTGLLVFSGCPDDGSDEKPTGSTDTSLHSSEGRYRN